MTRVLEFEKLLGGNLPEKFKTIDRLDRSSRTVTSIKTLDLRDSTYQTDAGVRGKLNEYLNSILDFSSYRRGGVAISRIRLRPQSNRNYFSTCSNKKQLEVIANWSENAKYINIIV